MQLDGPTGAGFMNSDSGGCGPVILHAALMNGTLWDTVVGLEDRYRCIVPELPFGAHTTPMPGEADLSLPSLATKLAKLRTELDLHQVTAVRNDRGGAQLVISPGGTDHVASLVPISCEAVDNYPPGQADWLLSATRRRSTAPSGSPNCRTRAGSAIPPVVFDALSKRPVLDDVFRS